MTSPATGACDGMVNTLDLIMLLPLLGTVYPTPDRQYLYQDIQIDIFAGPVGPSFTAVRSDGFVLRQNYANEAFFVDNSNGALVISHVDPGCDCAADDSE